MKKQTMEGLKMAGGNMVFTGTGYGLSKALDGPKSPDMSGDYDWSFLDQSPSVFKVNEVDNAGGGGHPHYQWWWV